MTAPTPKVQQKRALAGLLDELDPSLGGRTSDQVLIQWAPGTTRARQIEVRDALGGELVETILTEPMKASGYGPIDVLRVPRTSSAEAIIGDYSKQTDVIYAEVNQQVSIQYIPKDPGLGSLWGLSSNGAGIKADKAWDVSKGSIKNVVGIIDSGIDYTHPDLYKNVFLNQGEIKGLSWFSSLVDIDNDKLITFWDLNNSQNWSGSQNVALRLNDWNGNRYIDAGDLLDNRSGWEDGIDFDKNGYFDDLIGWDFVDNDNDPMDLNGHGTHVSGTIGAMGDNNVGVTGINFQIQMTGLRFLDANGRGYTSNAIKATDYFTDLKSRGLNGPDNFLATNNSWGGGGANTGLSGAISRADQAGILFVAAAGNSSTRSESYPAAFTQNNVISVAALTSSGALASYSNYGSTWVDLGAPGSGIYSTLPNGTYGTYSGTSMAAPHVTGAAALLATMFPTATAAQIKAALLDGTANPALAGKTLTGDQLDLTVAMTNLNKAVTGIPPSSGLTIWGTDGNDVLTGGNNNDTIAGVASTGTNLGKGQIDTLTGSLGADTFLLADARGTFYNDGNTRSQGTSDFAIIKDFNNIDGDRIQIKAGSQYLASYNTAANATYFYLGNGDNRFNAADELIARIDGVNLTPGSGAWIVDNASSLLKTI